MKLAVRFSVQNHTRMLMDIHLVVRKMMYTDGHMHRYIPFRARIRKILMRFEVLTAVKLLTVALWAFTVKSCGWLQTFRRHFHLHFDD
jgi:hypothetical protein